MPGRQSSERVEHSSPLVSTCGSRVRGSSSVPISTTRELVPQVRLAEEGQMKLLHKVLAIADADGADRRGWRSDVGLGGIDHYPRDDHDAYFRKRPLRGLSAGHHGDARGNGRAQ